MVQPRDMHFTFVQTFKSDEVKSGSLTSEFPRQRLKLAQ